MKEVIMEFFEELKWRGLVKDVTDEETLKEKLKSPITCYCGFDPTGPTLHVGHLQQILLLRRYQKAGHHVIALCGGATGMIGDPKPTTERQLQSLEVIGENVKSIKNQLAYFLDFEGSNPAKLVNNYDWLGNLNLLHFLRDYGKYFNVNYMLSKDIIASRLDSGISFTEFTYTILQAADFMHLYEHENCCLQIGGSDQWGNLTSGTELIRKVHPDAKVFGCTSPLITRSDGSKFGKSEGGKSVWLDPNKTDAYQFYQFWFNCADADVINFLKRLSFKSVEEIQDIEKQQLEAPHLRVAQKALAEELTLLVHGQEGLDAALNITKALFSGNIKELSAKEIEFAFKDAERKEIKEGSNLIDVLVEQGICSSKREAREFITNGSVSINGDKCNDLEKVLTKEDTIDGQLIVVRRGKKNYHILSL